MEQLGHPGFLQTYGETRAWLNACVDTEGKCTIDPDTLEVDIHNYNSDILDIETRLHNLGEYILVKFRNVSGDFTIRSNPKLLTLKGFPYYVSGWIKILNCPELLTLQYALCSAGIFTQDSNIGLISNATTISYVKNRNYLYGSKFSSTFFLGPSKRNSKDKADRYMEWMSKVSAEEYISCLSWLNEYDNDTYEEIIPHLIPMSIELGYDLGLSDDVLNIVNIAISTNHRM